MDNRQIEVRLAALEAVTARLEHEVAALGETSNNIGCDIKHIGQTQHLALDEFRRSLADQEARWTKAHKELTETAIDMMQQAMLKAFARKLLDWLWTLGFSAALVGLGWIATRTGFSH